MLHESEKGRRESISIAGAKPEVQPVETPHPPDTTTVQTPPNNTGADHPPEKDGTGQRVAGAVIGGVGVASGIIGAIFAGMYVSNHGTFTSDSCSTSNANLACPGLASNDQTYSTVAWVTAAIGGALLITGIVVFATAPRGGSKSANTVAPVLGAGFEGLSLRGVF